MPEYLKPAEVAALFRVDARTVKRWVQQGRLDGFQTPGGHWRITEESVHAMQQRRPDGTMLVVPETGD